MEYREAYARAVLVQSELYFIPVIRMTCKTGSKSIDSARIPGRDDYRGSSIGGHEGIRRQIESLPPRARLAATSSALKAPFATLPRVRYFVAGNQLRVLLAIFTNISITGTSTSTPTTVANAAPDCKPKRDIATATASSKKLLAPIIPAGAAIL